MNTSLNHIQNWLELAKDANWSVSKLAKLSCVSVRTLERHFHQKLGSTPKVWLLEQRQKYGANLICNGMSVKEAADLTGYKHSSTFSREYKKFWGAYPSSQASRSQISFRV